MTKRRYCRTCPKWEVDPTTDCWLGTGAVSSTGYGNTWDPDSKRNEAAHRLIYQRYKGSIPGGYDLDHLCRVRRCVNPDHLEPVMRAVNVRRGAVAILTTEQVSAIRFLHKWFGAKITRLARAFNVSEGAIREITKNRNWKGVE